MSYSLIWPTCARHWCECLVINVLLTSPSFPDLRLSTKASPAFPAYRIVASRRRAAIIIIDRSHVMRNPRRPTSFITAGIRTTGIRPSRAPYIQLHFLQNRSSDNRCQNPQRRLKASNRSKTFTFLIERSDREEMTKESMSLRAITEVKKRRKVGVGWMDDPRFDEQVQAFLIDSSFKPSRALAHPSPTNSSSHHRHNVWILEGREVSRRAW